VGPGLVPIHGLHRPEHYRDLSDLSFRSVVR
jgi:hypothetical protein